MREYDKDLQSIQEARELARNGKKAAKKMATFTQEQVDKIILKMKEVADENKYLLAEMAVEETGFGIVKDKAFKNYAASSMLYEEIKDMPTAGIIKADEKLCTIDVAEPVGLVLGIVPSTNPTSTIIFKAMIALKSRNAIVFAPHPAASKCSYKAAMLMRDAAIAAGAPENIIGCVSTPTMASTNELMNAKEVALIIATGGPGMVKAAYSVGKPAIGVGAGNSPAYIERTADVAKAVECIIGSKTFDNGTICASEQSIICEECNRVDVVRELQKQGGYFMSDEETAKVCKVLFKNGHTMDARMVGRTPQVIAEAAGIEIPANTKVLIGRQHGVGPDNPLSYEKLTTVLGFYVVKDWQEACELSIDLLQNGIGHTMSIHTNDRDTVLRFTVKPASRILVNTGGSQGGTGISTSLPISFTLGCGAAGGSSVSENVSPLHLLNIKKVAYGITDLKDLKMPEDNTATQTCATTAHSCGCDTNLTNEEIEVAESAIEKLTDSDFMDEALLAKALSFLTGNNPENQFLPCGCGGPKPKPEVAAKPVVPTTPKAEAVTPKVNTAEEVDKEELAKLVKDIMMNMNK
ncbi:acetaldehyde dehydrogenase [Granulicatella balaenopterae]|uniref:Acetaldehyde dehydrogenase n=1 Tax=Granulicatella balaenopterae TaxID=137733 RepID=A0A1H9HAA1_9LACT|nr:acetaldehyde dehydrogenase (acetylating) [Granulicatella balaenopterae]SEQ59299.1 acetaldehyde dehydrogenase [Granulicatella balaenopterae]